MIPDSWPRGHPTTNRNQKSARDRADITYRKGSTWLSIFIAEPLLLPGSVSYSAAIESAASKDIDEHMSPFAQRVDREAHRRSFDHASRRVVLGDGALWIWNLAKEQFPGAIQIVDIFHAKGHLWDVGKAIYGASTDLADHWSKLRRDELDQGKIGKVLGALRQHAANHEEARKCLEYFHRNRNRMRYPKFREQGLCVSTGVVEAGCKLAMAPG